MPPFSRCTLDQKARFPDPKTRLRPPSRFGGTRICSWRTSRFDPEFRSKDLSLIFLWHLSRRRHTSLAPTVEVIHFLLPPRIRFDSRNNVDDYSHSRSIEEEFIRGYGDLKVIKHRSQFGNIIYLFRHVLRMIFTSYAKGRNFLLTFVPRHFSCHG